MLPRSTQVGPLVSAVSNLYATAQSGTANTALTLTGSVPAVARRLIITSAGNDAGMTFTVVGTLKDGSPVTEVMNGANGLATNLQGQTYSMLDYATVVSITPSANTASTVTAGTNGVASSTWLRLDNFGFAQTALEAIVTGTVNYTIEEAVRDPNSLVYTLTPANLVWQPNADLQALTANSFGSYSASPSWVRCTLNSGTGSVEFTVTQAGAVPF